MDMENITIEVSPETLARARQYGEPAELFGRLVEDRYGAQKANPPWPPGFELPLNWPRPDPGPVFGHEGRTLGEIIGIKRADGMRQDHRYAGPMETWPQPEGAQNMTPEERAAMWGSSIRNEERPWIASEDELVERVEKRRETMRRLFPPRPSLLARLRRWLS